MAWLYCLSIYLSMNCCFVTVFLNLWKMVALRRTQLKPICKSDKLQKLQQKYGFSYLQLDWALILECGNRMYCTNEKLLLTSHLFIKEGCLFVLFCLSHWELSIHVVPTMLLVRFEKPSISGVHWGGFLMLWFMVHEVLNVEQYYHWNFLGKLGHALVDIVRKSSLTMVLSRWFCNF